MTPLREVEAVRREEAHVYGSIRVQRRRVHVLHEGLGDEGEVVLVEDLTVREVQFVHRVLNAGALNEGVVEFGMTFAGALPDACVEIFAERLCGVGLSKLF